MPTFVTEKPSKVGVLWTKQPLVDKTAPGGLNKTEWAGTVPAHF